MNENLETRRAEREAGVPDADVAPSVSFVELNHQLAWLHENRHAIRLMLPQSTPEPAVKRRRSELAWLHTTTSTRRLYRLGEQGRASIQEVTSRSEVGAGKPACSSATNSTLDPSRRPASVTAGPSASTVV